MPAAPDRPGRLPIGELNSLVSKASALISLYEKQANSGIGGQAELERVQHEMKAIKKEVLSCLTHSKSIIQKFQKG